LFCIIADETAFPISLVSELQSEKPMKLPVIFILGVLFYLSTGSEIFAQDNTHKVKSGESLSLIARKYKTSVDELIRLNPEAEKGLKAGATLQLPAESADAGNVSKQVIGGDKLHKVVSGESLSRIAKKYKVSIADLEKWNNMRASDLKAGQELRISGSVEMEPAKAAPVVQEKVEKITEPSSRGTHLVVKGETLSSIAQKEGTTVAIIREMNQLKNDRVNLGQILKVPVSKSSGEITKPVEPKVQPKVKIEEVIKKEPEQKVAKEESPSQATESVSIQPSQKVNEIPAKQEERASAGIREISNTMGYTRIVETGFAEAIEGDLNSKKHLCLHKSAAIGSILQVKNEVNGQSVFVKVIGKLPETGSNEKIIIRISRQAYERLMASGKRFPVEVSYPESQQ